MTLQARIEEDFKTAFKTSDKQTLEILRLLKTAFMSALIEKRVKEGKREVELTDEEIEAVIKKQVKGLEEAIELYKQGGRRDLIDQTEREVVILKKYLPAELSEDAAREVVKAVIERLGKLQRQEFGKVMGEAMKELKGKASGDAVARLVKELLASTSA